MSVAVVEHEAPVASPAETTVPTRAWAPARAVPPSWPATVQNRQAAWELLSARRFETDAADGHHRTSHGTGLGLLLDWLADQPGNSWQERWLASGIEADRPWRRGPVVWLHHHGQTSRWVEDAFFRALRLAIGVDLFRPSLTWLTRAEFRHGSLTNVMARHRDPDGFARLHQLAAASPDVAPAAVTRTGYRASLVLAAKGGVLSDITIGDVEEFFSIEAAARGTSVGATHLFYSVLHTMGVFGDRAPASLRELRTSGQQSPGELIDRYQLACRPVRDVLVDYLKERQPALDYTSLQRLADYLGRIFWADLERHHPGIDSLHLTAEIADAWKRRLRTIDKTVRTADGQRITATVARMSYRECLTPVRAFYLDLAQWALEDPGRWGRWVAPCPIGAEELDRRKSKHRRKARMDARTRERLPVLPILVHSVDQRRRDAAELLAAARQADPGVEFTAAGQSLVRIRPPRSAQSKIWATTRPPGAAATWSAKRRPRSGRSPPWKS